MNTDLRNHERKNTIVGYYPETILNFRKIGQEVANLQEIYLIHHV